MITVLLTLRAALRMLFLLVVLIIGGALILLLSLAPLRIQGIPLAALPLWLMMRPFMFALGVRYQCDNPAAVRNHEGFIFCNHVSFLDTLMVLYLTPARFLSTWGVRKLPLIGWIAQAIETIFVNRKSEESRAASRAELAEQLRQRKYPPVALFPEGKIGPGNSVLPFRYGAFEVAIDGQVPILPCVLVFEPLEVIAWYGKQDLLPTLAWRVASLSRPLQARLIPLEVVLPQPGDDAAVLAEATRQRVEGALQAACGKM